MHHGCTLARPFSLAGFEPRVMWAYCTLAAPRILNRAFCCSRAVVALLLGGACRYVMNWFVEGVDPC